MRVRSLSVIGLAAGAFALGTFGASLSALAPQARPAGQTAPATPAASAGPSGVREAAWSPDGKRLAASWFDVIWTMAPDGTNPKRLVPAPRPDQPLTGWISERDPVWSPDGKSIAFAVSAADGFDLWIAPSAGGPARRVTSFAGDERWPSFTPDGRLLFSHRSKTGLWQLFVGPTDASSPPIQLSSGDASEWQGRVSPDGKLVAFVSDREPEPDNDTDIWVSELLGGADKRPRRVRVTRAPGDESYPAWAPDNGRVAYAASRGSGLAVWVAVVPPFEAPAGDAQRGGGRGPGRGARGGGAGGAPSTPSGVPDLLASRHGGVPAWSPDAASLAIATFTPAGGGGYNGNPRRNDDEPPAAFADADDHVLWRVVAPRAVDEQAASLKMLPAPDSARWAAAFDQVWLTLKSMYYASGPSAVAWDALRAKYRPRALEARDAAQAEQIIDELVAEQPLIKEALESPRGVVASGHPLASAAGAPCSRRAATSSTPASRCRSRLASSSRMRRASAATARRSCSSRACPSRSSSSTRTCRRATRRPTIRSCSRRRAAAPRADGPTVATIPGVVAGHGPAVPEVRQQESRVEGSRRAGDQARRRRLRPRRSAADDDCSRGATRSRSIPSRRRCSCPAVACRGRARGSSTRTTPRRCGRSRKRAGSRSTAGRSRSGSSRTWRRTAASSPPKISRSTARWSGSRWSGSIAATSSTRCRRRCRTGLQIVETLNILDHYQPSAGATYTTDADYLHHVIEAWRVRDGGARIADPGTLAGGLRQPPRARRTRWSGSS